MRNLLFSTAIVAIIFLPAADASALSFKEQFRQLRGEQKEERQELLQQQKNERAVLRQERHKDRLARVTGIIRGMTNKLDNLSQRLNRQLEAVERRINALKEAGHPIVVDEELQALKDAIASMQTKITEAKAALEAIPDSETPRERAAKAREIVRGLRDDLKKVRDAFHALHIAVRQDLKPSASPSVSPSPTL